MKKIGKLYVASRDEWRLWLKENYDSKKGVWLIHYKKYTGKPSIPYYDAVEEALCFGWIDSIVKKIDDEKFARKFTPRKDKSRWSELNKKRAAKMIKVGKMTKAGIIKVVEAKKSGEWFKTATVKKELEIPPFMREALAANKRAQNFFNSLAGSYRRNIIGWVSSAKREETRERRLAEVISLLEQRKKLGLK